MDSYKERKEEITYMSQLTQKLNEEKKKLIEKKQSQVREA